VEGFQVAFTSAAILVTVGAILLAVLLRSRDVANVNPDVRSHGGRRPTPEAVPETGP
jgi:hypothetical protein